jgi:phenylacetate-CoA ligase
MIRPVLASIWGYRLRQLRYGDQTEELVAESLERETWTIERWTAWQQEQLIRILHRAATRVPYYREHWRRRRASGDARSWEYLEHWPILEKSELRKYPTAFIADDCDIRSLHHEKTSGTTGNPLDFWVTSKTIQHWYAIGEARWRRWYGVSRHDRWAILGAQLVAPTRQKEPPYWVFNRGLNQLYMSTYHISGTSSPQYLDAIRDHGVRYLWGHSSALHALAKACERLGRDDLKMKVVLTSSEPLLRSQRASIRTAFHAPLRETYGMTEMAAAASECEHDAVHLWPEVGFYEFISGTRSAPRDCAADLVSTSFLHHAMPLIRYRIGDMAVAAPEGSVCPCGRTLPLLGSLVGRTSDMLYSPDGREITPSSMEVVFDTNIEIEEAQIIQERLACIRVRYVPTPKFSQRDGLLLRTRIQERMGEVEVALEPVVQIPRGPNGKFQAVRCDLGPDDLALVASRAKGQPLAILRKPSR